MGLVFAKLPLANPISFFFLCALLKPLDCRLPDTRLRLCLDGISSSLSGCRVDDDDDDDGKGWLDIGSP